MNQFIQDVRDQVAQELAAQDPQLERLAFSILAVIDGEAGELAYELRPVEEDGSIGPDIAGNLHGELLGE